MIGLATWLAASRLTGFLSHNAVAFPLLEILHVLAISLVLGTVFIFDLRLLGWSWREWPAARLLETLRPFAIFGFALALFSGGLLFASQPLSYLANWPFRIKLALLAAAGVNLALFHTVLARRIGDHSPAIPLPARLSAAFSLVSWSAILVAGRFIGFFLQG